MFAISGRMAAVVAALALLAAAPSAVAATTSLDTRVTMSDGVSFHATVSGEAQLAPRPVIVEFSPYGPGTGTTQDGSAYNYLPSRSAAPATAMGSSTRSGRAPSRTSSRRCAGLVGNRGATAGSA
jgi:hypothetical protein